jgi:hypothetical protein
MVLGIKSKLYIFVLEGVSFPILFSLFKKSRKNVQTLFKFHNYYTQPISKLVLPA